MMALTVVPFEKVKFEFLDTLFYLATESEDIRSKGEISKIFG